ncbi:helix-turn-helix domain-containing protein [Paenibacillaceae bacterium WGS1546]|uniref:helix-turn-helix domain-containing protein n=1 Tax=Cohnella sp. WGS1546 TaxID=3366810 RepID=UPI00372D7F4A
MPTGFRSRKYLRRLIVSLIVFVALVLCVFAFALYWNIKDGTMKQQQEANRKVLAQIKYNVGYMDEILRNLMMSLYFDHEATSLLHSQQFSYRDVAIKLARLDKLADSSTYLHSITVYNANTDTYLSTNRSFQDNLAGQIESFEAQLAERSELPNMKPIPIHPAAASASDKVEFFSYMMQDASADRSAETSRLILNVKPEWVFNNLAVMNDLAYDRSNSLLLMEIDGMLYTNDNEKASSLTEEAVARIREAEAEFEAFVVGGDRGKTLVTVMPLGIYPWKVVSVQSYDYAFKEVERTRGMLILITAAFLLLSGILAWLLSNRLYRPLDRMLGRLKGWNAPGAAMQKDEWSFLHDAYASMMEKATSAERTQARNRRIIRQFQVRSLLEGSSGLSREQFAQLWQEQKLPFGAEGPYLLGLCKLDQEGGRFRQAGSKEKAMYRFALGNIAEEWLSKRCSPIWLETDKGSGEFVFLGTLAGEFDSDAFAEELRQLQRYLQTSYQLTVAFAYPEPFDDYRLISDAYNRAKELMKYRMLLGVTAILSEGTVRESERDEDILQATDREKRMIEHLRAGNGEALGEDFRAFFQYASGLTFGHFMNAVLHMTVAVVKTIGEMNENRIRPLNMDIRHFYQEVLERETAVDMEALFQQLAAQVGDPNVRGDGERTDILCRTMKDIIAENYADPDFGLPSIAQLLKMSSAYIGRQFKQGTGQSVTEYLNDVRLERALELLETEEMSVNEVMEGSGYRSQSHFFKQFKIKYGTSPKSYRLRRAMKQ